MTGQPAAYPPGTTAPHRPLRALPGTLLAAAVAVVGLVVAVTVVLAGHTRSTTETVSYPDDQVKVVIVDGVAGDIRVRHIQGDGPQVRITRTVSSSVLPPRLDTRLVDGKLTLTAECRSPAVGDCSVDYDIEVGDRQEAYRLHSTSGDVQASWIMGEIEVVADSGSVTLANVGGRSVAGTASGDVRISCLAPPSYLGAFSTGGSATIQLPHGPPYRVSTHTESGPVRVAVDHEPPGPMQIVAHTTDGAITVTY